MTLTKRIENKKYEFSVIDKAGNICGVYNFSGYVNMNSEPVFFARKDYAYSPEQLCEIARLPNSTPGMQEALNYDK